MLGKSVNVWGAFTTGDDKIIIEEVETQGKTIYLVKETSYQVPNMYMYDTLPPVLQELISRTNAVVKPHNSYLILYGPHLSKKLTGIPVYQFPQEYFFTYHEIEEAVPEDKTMKQVLKWLEGLLQI